MLYGYAGHTLRIDLSSGIIEKQPLKQAWVDEFIGGRGFTAKILYDEIPPGTDPLGPDNRFVIAMGPLSGLFLPAAGKTHFAAKSPATGGYGDSNMGGHFGVTMKYAGYDVTILTGRAQEPSYIFIDNDTVEIRPAAHLWGKGSTEVEEILKTDLGREFQILTIGEAGERMVNFACISHDFGRQAGRTGIGAV
ncbi:MAG: aldehyde ferredoxin oxidoreductase N-terminal domain-containing protein, partial [Desulfotignum sp.]